MKIFLDSSLLIEHEKLSQTALPNDAIILAACKLHKVQVLASHDSDFFKD